MFPLQRGRLLVELAKQRKITSSTPINKRAKLDTDQQQVPEDWKLSNISINSSFLEIDPDFSFDFGRDTIVDISSILARSSETNEERNEPIQGTNCATPVSTTETIDDIGERQVTAAVTEVNNPVVMARSSTEDSNASNKKNSNHLKTVNENHRGCSSVGFYETMSIILDAEKEIMPPSFDDVPSVDEEQFNGDISFRQASTPRYANENMTGDSFTNLKEVATTDNETPSLSTLE